MRFLGMNITPYTVEEGAYAVIERAVLHQGGYVCTVNATMAEEASRSASLLAAIQGASFCVADGAGLCYALSYLYKKKIDRCAGVDLGKRVLSLAAERGLSVGLWGAAPGVAVKAAEALQKEIPRLCVTFVRNGYERGVPEELMLTPPDLLFVCQGSPRQELLMQSLQKSMPHTVMLGLGGSLDVYAGKCRRAPRFMQRAGLEWMYRCMREPHRLRRLHPLAFYRLTLHEKKRSSDKAKKPSAEVFWGKNRKFLQKNEKTLVKDK